MNIGETQSHIRALGQWNRDTWLRVALAGPLTTTALQQIAACLANGPDLSALSENALIRAGVSSTAAKLLLRPDSALDPAREWLEQSGNQLLTLISPEYPPLLREIPDPPVTLFASGHYEFLPLPQLAIVGSRNPTPAGEITAQRFARYFAGRGLAITSGLATGIDAASHSGALDADGITIAVCATGLDLTYPAVNKALAARIAERGALISEFPLGSAPRRHHFPRRNRIISGLAVGTLVVEAARRSGSLITARTALEQGREVFAVPGSIHNPMARGCHRLIRGGAKLVETAEDVLEEISGLVGAQLELAGEPPEAPPVSEDPLDSDYIRLLDSMGFEPVNQDTLVERSGLTAAEVSSMLLILELRGTVAAGHGGLFYRTGANGRNS
ncbi:MAG: DNA-processing protein DprA [Chromatiales bacterium]|jgi:DNA processing protein